MANSDRPNGASCVGEALRLTKYVADEAIYPGDFVNKTAAGKIKPAAASEPLLGVAVGYAAADGDEVQIADNPDQLFMIQADGADINIQTDIGLNYNIVATAGNSAYKLSRQELDSSSGATTATLPLTLIDKLDAPDNAFGWFCKCIVQINNHQYSGGTGTVGV